MDVYLIGSANHTDYTTTRNRRPGRRKIKAQLLWLTPGQLALLVVVLEQQLEHCLAECGLCLEE
jgi:hypothetical protein